MKYISYSKKKTTKVKVIMQHGDGKININNISIKKFFCNCFNTNYIFLPLFISNLNNFNFKIKTKGGGLQSQINAIKIGICKCILLFNYNFYKIFRKLNFVTIDDRRVERKKYGFKKSRKKEQYSKR